MFKSRTTSAKYQKNLLQLKSLAPSLFYFLDAMGRDQNGYWISAATNLHLYKYNFFFCYIQFENFSLLVSPDFHGQIETGCKDDSTRFYRFFKNQVEKHDGFNKGWAVNSEGFSILLKSKTPITFFEELVNTDYTVSKPEKPE